MTLLAIALACTTALFGALYLHTWFRLRALIAAQAERAAEALVGTCLVDGVTLPLPSLDGWKLEVATKENSKKVRLLTFGDTVRVSEEFLYLGTRSAGVTLDREVATSSNAAYIKRVWAAYHSRQVQKVIL
jgi:hypothetical protein